jgi:hypothetical protein
MHTLIRAVDWGDLPPTGVTLSSLCIYELNQRREGPTTVHNLRDVIFQRRVGASHTRTCLK